MSNEELMRRFAAGDQEAFEDLYKNNVGLIRDRARHIAERYGCAGKEETLSELESVGALAFVECLCAGKYDEAKGKLTTFVVPYLDGAMHKFLKEEMHFPSVISSDEDCVIQEQVADQNIEESVERIVEGKIETEEMRCCFEQLPKRDRDIVGKCFGAYGYPKWKLRDIAMFHLIKEDAVEKAKRRALAKMLMLYWHEK